MPPRPALSRDGWGCRRFRGASGGTIKDRTTIAQNVRRLCDEDAFQIKEPPRNFPGANTFLEPPERPDLGPTSDIL
jgi:hypothetical protein